ncbi:hypothetical protein F511_40890 [Dorcoceras hygrometricum]|uniref:Uncharacterized protein n=1 Tax=Dorcoceras hygrometricum TaxID=472368 RepID=A0A2Z7BAM5_9LAMI|nr:hypothetical protein F511_40890 [Dorcoceras hygrometricum]
MGCPGHARTKPRRKISRRNDAEKHAGRRSHGGGRRHHVARGTRPHTAATRAMRLAVAQQIASIAVHGGLPVALSSRVHVRRRSPAFGRHVRPARNEVRAAAGHGRPPCAASAHGIQLAVGPQPLWLRNHNFGLAQRIMVIYRTTIVRAFQMVTICRVDKSEQKSAAPLPQPHARPPPTVADRRRPPSCNRTCSDQFFEVIPSVANTSSLLVQNDGGRLNPVVDLIGGSTAAYREEPDFPCDFWLEPGA